MKNLYAALLILILSPALWAQKVPSICTGPDSVVQFYQDDADRLALNYLQKLKHPLYDSVEISKAHSDTILDALIAVYNATSLPARDTVVDRFNIHSFPYPNLRNFSVSADSTLNWMQQLKNGIIPTGNSTIDSLMNRYHIQLDFYYSYRLPMPFHTAYMKCDSNTNIQALTEAFNPIPGVHWAELESVYGDGYSIQSSINSDHVELIYSIGWGDCPSGCINRRFWKFKVYYDCSVEFCGSYGDVLSSPSLPSVYQSIRIFPNPFSNQLHFKGVDLNSEFTLYDPAGREVKTGTLSGSELSGLEELKPGPYFIRVQSKGEIMTFRLIKE
ncbi:T9SS type A sorting domain-containing protein [bacterium SCSIO 12741]|nr:T9SS type A sorting domain-containing protein [bacterium SCSIO 12741]